MDIRTNIKISLFEAPNGEPIALPKGKTTRLTGFIVLPSNLAAAPAAQIDLGLVADETLGAVSVSIATKVIDLSADLYSQGSLVPDAIQDLSAPVTPGAVMKAVFTGGDLANVANGKALRIEIIRFGGVGRSDHEAGAQLLTAYLSILVVDQSVTDHAVLSNLSWTNSAHTGTANRLAGFDGAGAAGLIDYSTDFLSQYLLKAGRAGGQTFIGGSGAADPLIIRATAGVGAAGSDIVFQVGNNGATEAMRILFDGKVGIGTAVPGGKLDVYFTPPSSLVTAKVLNLFSTTDTGPSTTSKGAFQIGFDNTNGISFGSVNSAPFPNWIQGMASRVADGSVYPLALNPLGGNISIGTLSFPSGGSGGLIFGDRSVLSSMAANTAGFYADDFAGNVSMVAICEDGAKINLIKTNAYTQTYSAADRTLSAYTADDESAAYTGIDNAQAGTPYAQVADLSALRVAYENLRAFVEDIAGMVNGIVDDFQTIGMVG